MMFGLKKIISAMLTAGALLFSAGSANAALVNFQLIGDVTFSNGFGGLSAGNTITATGIFDDSVLSGGSGTVLFSGNNSSNTFSIAAGSYTFNQTMDTLYSATNGPSLTLSSNALSDFSYGAISGTNSAPANFDSFFLSFGSNAALTGTWRTTVQMSPVPVPAAVWLFGSGLLGLVGIARRKKRA